MRYRIVNRTRFIVFVLAVCIAVCFVIGGMVNISAAKEKRDLRYTEVTVRDGDTLWAIAKECGRTDADIREVIWEICSVNGVKASDLRPGQVLKVPQ